MKPKQQKLISLVVIALAGLTLTGCNKKRQEAPAGPNKTIMKTDNRVDSQTVIKKALVQNNYVKSYRMINIKQMGNKKPVKVSYCLGNTPLKMASYMNNDKNPAMYADDGTLYFRAKSNTGKTVWLKQDNENKAHTLVSNNAQSANEYMNTLANPTLANLATAKKNDSGYTIQIKSSKANLKTLATQYKAKKNVKLVDYSLFMTTDKKYNLKFFKQVMAYSYKGKTQTQRLIIDKVNQFNNLSVPKSVIKHAINQNKVRVN